MKLIKFISLTSLIIVISVILAGCQRQQKGTTPVKINGKTYQMEVVQTPAAREQGLSGRDEIGSEGMVFIFDSPAKHGFWMKDMKFGLDFLWVKDSRIIAINRDIPPLDQNGQISTIYPQTEVDMVIEVAVGFADQEQLRVGDMVEVGR